MDIRCEGLVDRRENLPDDERRYRRRVRADGGGWRPLDVRAIVLHQTAGIPFTGPILDRRGRPRDTTWEEALDTNHRAATRLYRIDAHFVVLSNGVIYYTRDVATDRSGSAGRSRGVDIEFAGVFAHDATPPAAGRVPREMLRAGRRLVRALVEQVGTITHIHPHGQIQNQDAEGACGGTTGNRCGKIESCPGPDIWVNVGAWACTEAGGLGLVCDPVLAGAGYARRAIEPAQSNPAYAVSDL